MTIFGNRDFDVAPPLPSPRGELAGWEDIPPPEHPQPIPLPVSVETRRVVMRVQGGEEIELARAEGREPAVRLAREAIQDVEGAIELGEWPSVGDRFVRPGAIVSIDVQRTE